MAGKGRPAPVPPDRRRKGQREGHRGEKNDLGASSTAVSAVSEKVTGSLSNPAIYEACAPFTSAPIAKALVDAHREQVSVEAILDKSQATEEVQRRHLSCQ